VKPSLWLCLFVPLLAFADLNETTVLQTNATVNLETGAVADSGGDLTWTGTILSLQSGVKDADLGAQGVTGFDFYTLAELNTFVAAAKATPVPAAKLVAGELILVVDHAGRVSKVFVLANNGDSILIEFVTYGATPVVGVPSIAGVFNNSSLTPFGYPNYGIAPSSLLVIKGSNLADPGAPVLQSSADPGLPLTLNGASVTVTVNGVTTHPAIYYTSPAQIAAVLPAATPTGMGTITVTYRGSISAPMQIHVLPSALGFNSYFTNSAVATDALSGTLLTFTNAGTAGEIITLWATGLGADPADSDSTYTLTPHQVSVPLQIYIGGLPATINYQGASVYPGVNQINVTIPDGVIAGCFVTLVGVAQGTTSNTVSIPVNPGGGPCVEPSSGLTGNQVLGPSNQTLHTATLAVGQTNTPSKTGRSISNFTDAAFVSYTGLYSPGNPVSPGGCILNDENVVAVPPVVGMNVGAIELLGPNALDVIMKSQGINGTGFADLSTTAIPSTGGTFTFKIGGGTDVHGFSIDVTFANPLVNWTNSSLAATLDRTQPLPLTWTGGNSGPHTFTFILGSVATPLRGRGFTCLTSADAGQFTVPSYILAAMPAGNSGVQLQNSIQLPLSVPGIDLGLAIGQISYSVTGTIK